ncbi:MAG: hypothetical protein ACYDGR_09330, partial [Candidatus Dormibacteria bacterium]
ALAVRTDAPIMVSDDVLEKAGVIPEGETEEMGEFAEASIFKELVNNMDLPDLGDPDARPGSLS